jgi:protein-S-isoprenylcysteine O-methyltransferase Ste14
MSLLTHSLVAHQNGASMKHKKLLQQLAVGAAGGAIVALISKRFHFQFEHIPFFARDAVLLSHKPFLFAGMIGWVLFSLYWEAAGAHAAAAKSSESSGSRAFHVALANIALVLEIVPIRAFGRFLPDSYIVMTTGLIIEAAGLLLAIWARRHLGQNWSGRISVMAHHDLIKSGPYRLLRHPIYTGLLWMYFGVALVTGEWLAVIGVAIAVFAYWRKIRLEEATLGTAFGEGYADYRRETWALLPGVY